MKIKRKEYEALKIEAKAYYDMLQTRLIVEVPQTLGPEAEALDIPPMMTLMSMTLEHAAMVAKFGGYENHAGEVLQGPFAIRLVRDDPANGYEHYLYHRFTKDGRSVLTYEKTPTLLDSDGPGS